MTVSNGPEAAAQNEADLKALAKGGRTNVFGFVLRLLARLPFLFIAGRLYGPEVLGRFAYAILIVEFVAQLATLGLRRGLAEALSKQDRPDTHVVGDAMLVATFASALGAAVLIALPQLMFPNSPLNGLDRYLPLTIFAIVWTDIALAALAYRFDVASTVRARAIVEPWTISIAAGALFFYSARDGLILSYVASILAAMLTALWPLWRSYGTPQGWRPRPVELYRLARRNLPLAAADAAEWGSRRLDLAILGLFASPAVVGIYYVAQQVASLPQKLKSSFDPILGPVITRNLQAKNYGRLHGRSARSVSGLSPPRSASRLRSASRVRRSWGWLGPNLSAAPRQWPSCSQQRWRRRLRSSAKARSSIWRGTATSYCRSPCSHCRWF